MDDWYRESRLNILQLNLGPQTKQIIGPTELVAWIQGVQKLPMAEHDKMAAFLKKLESWGVICATTGEYVPYSEIKYWSVEKQEVYKDATAVPTPDCYKQDDTTCSG